MQSGSLEKAVQKSTHQSLESALHLLALGCISRTMPHLIERHEENCDEGQHHAHQIVFAGNLFIDQQRDN